MSKEKLPRNPWEEPDSKVTPDRLIINMFSSLLSSFKPEKNTIACNIALSNVIQHNIKAIDNLTMKKGDYDYI